MQPTAVPEVTPTLRAGDLESQSGVEVGDRDGKFVLGGTFTLRSGERLRGDLVVFGGRATLEGDTRVDGSIVIIGGKADVAGRVSGDMVLIGGGGVRLRSTAEVDGQLVRVGGALQKTPARRFTAASRTARRSRLSLPSPRAPVRILAPTRACNMFLNFVADVVCALARRWCWHSGDVRRHTVA